MMSSTEISRNLLMHYSLPKTPRSWQNRIRICFSAKIISCKKILMLENLINLIEQHAGDAVVNNPAVPNEQNNAVIQEAGNSIIGSLQNMVAQGNMQDV